MKINQQIGRKLALATALILGVIIGAWLLTQQRRQEDNRVSHPKTDQEKVGSSGSNAFVSGRTSGNFSGAISTGLAKAVNAPEAVDRQTMLRQLKTWIRKREGHDVEIVSAYDIRDLDGNPRAMNVLVTARLNGGLTVEKLKEKLDVVNAREHVLREKLLDARQQEDIAGVNRLVAELSETRTAFVTNNEVASYKVSLVKELPPVLAFWPGLPFETVREEAARSLAVKKLGSDIGLQGLVHYTSATALLCFTNNAGASVYVDPFRVSEVPLTALQALRDSKRQREDDGREGRIAAQWDDFLQP